MADMATVTSMGTFLDSLSGLLREREGLRGVNVFSAPIADLALLGPEHIVLGVEPIDNEFSYLVGTPMERIDELYPVDGYCITATAIPPKSTEEDAIKIARDRAQEIFREIYNQLRASNEGGTAGTEAALGVWDARIVRLRMTQTINDEPFARICEIRFTIRVKAKFTPAD